MQRSLTNKDRFHSYIIANASIFRNFHFYLLSPRFLINSFAALYGYDFQKPEWKAFYENFDWYEPTTSNPEFTEFESDLIQRLKASEIYSNEMGLFSEEIEVQIQTGFRGWIFVIAGVVLIFGIGMIVLIGKKRSKR